MRAILTSNVRPRIGRSLPISSHSANVLVRRTILPAARRKLTFCDAFTILLAPILTAAFIADITHKDNQIQEWDRVIAKVQAETEALRERELRSWSSLQLSSVTAGLVHQRRAYSTSAAATHASQSGVDGQHGATSSDSTTWSTFSSTTKPKHTIDFQAVDLQSYEKCVAVKVALDLLLHLRTGRHTRPRWIQRWAQSDSMEIGLHNESLETLIDRLAEVNEVIYRLRTEFWSKRENPTRITPEREQLDETIGNLTWRCRTGDISMPDMIYGYARAVMTSSTGPSLVAYRRLVDTLSIVDADATSYLALSCYTNTTQILDDETVWSMIYQYGQLKDSEQLHRLVWDLAGPQVNYRAETRWETVFVGDIGVPVPTNRHPKLLQNLIRAALQNQQPHKARAWAIVLMRHHSSHPRITRVMNTFLVYCIQHLDWMAGQFWLNLTISWAAFAAQNFPSGWKVLVFRMLELCVACEKPEIYDQIMKAVTTAGIEAPPIDLNRPENFTPRAQDIRNDWTAQFNDTAASARKPDGAISEVTLSAARTFQQEIAKTNPSMKPFVGIIDAEKLPLLKDAGRDIEHKDRSTALQFPHVSTTWCSTAPPTDNGKLSEFTPAPQDSETSKSTLEMQVQRLQEKQRTLHKQLKQEQDKNAALMQIHQEELKVLADENEKLRRTSKTSVTISPLSTMLQKERIIRQREQSKMRKPGD